jgi:hypothetical protein
MPSDRRGKRRILFELRLPRSIEESVKTSDLIGSICRDSEQRNSDEEG